MRHGSLFSGIGGFDLAAEWMGWQNVFHCEWNPFGQKVLKYYWPNAISYNDITKSTFIVHRGTIDILTGGFPCQPFSTAGKREGTDDDRYLWPEMLRVIREVQPRYIVGENVRGLVNWSGGLVFDTVCADLEAEGYEILPVLLPAAGVNAPHRRDRIWFIAYSNISSTKYKIPTGRNMSSSNDKFITDSNRNRLERGISTDINRQISTKEGHGEEYISTHGKTIPFQYFPTVDPICNGNDGLSDRLDGITFSKWRKESIKGGGNAIVPQVAFQIFKTIEQYERLFY